MFSLAAVLLVGVRMAIASATVSLLSVGLFKSPGRDRGLAHIALSPCAEWKRLRICRCPCDRQEQFGWSDVGLTAAAVTPATLG